MPPRRVASQNRMPSLARQTAAIINSRAMQNFLSRQRFQIVPPSRTTRRIGVLGPRLNSSASSATRNRDNSSANNSTATQRRRSRRRTAAQARARRSHLVAELQQAELENVRGILDCNISLNSNDLMSALHLLCTWCTSASSLSLQSTLENGSIHFILRSNAVTDSAENANAQVDNDQNPRQGDQERNENLGRLDQDSNESVDDENHQSVQDSNDENLSQEVQHEQGENQRQEVQNHFENAYDQSEHDEDQVVNNENCKNI